MLIIQTTVNRLMLNGYVCLVMEQSILILFHSDLKSRRREIDPSPSNRRGDFCFMEVNVDIQTLTEIVEQNTGAIFLSSVRECDEPGMVPLSPMLLEGSGEFDEVDKFWSHFFAIEAWFNNHGELTDESRHNILTHLEAIQASARAISLAILYERTIMPPRVTEYASSSR